MEKEVTVTCNKSQVDIYRIRLKEHHTWADIVLDDLGNGRGQIMINSDYGTWAYYWASMGEGLKEFLTTCEMSYLIGKFGRGQRVFDEEATKKCMIRDLNDMSNGRPDKALIREIENGSWSSGHDLHYNISDELRDAFPDHIHIADMPEPSLVRFMEQVFGEFQKILKVELEQIQE